MIPTNSKENQLNLLDLRLQKNTKVDAFSYNPQGYKLSLSLKDIQSDNRKSRKTNFLQLSLGQQPLKIVITSGYSLPQLKLQDNPGNPKEIEFLYTPNNEEFKLPITQAVDISVGLPNPSENESEQWFRGKIEVTNMKFYTEDQSGTDIRDNLRTSTILRGEIRMAERELKMQRKQFLMPKPETPGIQLIRSIELPSNSSQDAQVLISDGALKTQTPPKGLEVRFSGEAQKIQVGLDSRFPVASIQAGFLTGKLPSDIVTFLISGLASIIITLLTWLLSNFSK
ncbi:hypothetical protein DP113_05935 [Brasilonema octagenarum UFV-E1]|uniref:Uncharacterized protein n=2 Tax=Brasilonema TaxID=383614 RepID=A0A856MEX1_9CYAN|nr:MULTISPECIES: hypothetical protein [Brasilonema]NMF67023.1 hypothetical protein [Brasilonema octagenarum UFV-OR1]QDL07506.1 hypothetical protein DP114_05980 [Brasilonema sennae CENA114]QDL13868.1 hypothetical protein DP113_05935 [Brasilonema octagenarum UFV-E1]